ncbi:MAG: 3-deoxy-manno-octulosonate cytidylyltransferase [Candidatus Sumerlaeia bacterium]|nr:3-deoxy-manno-octulosonate cytidylyltransferase [Candidatus Sumerlaeia bacterium]
MKTVCVIPARHASVRLPGKPLLPILGIPMVRWVIRAARRFEFVEQILVATDHEGIAAAAREENVEAIMTDPDLPSGTDRIRAAMKGRPGDVIINLQGDEPGMPADAVRLAWNALVQSDCHAATACVPITCRDIFESPNAVKVVRDRNQRALYFSRSPIPSLARRDETEMRQPGYIYGHKHLGLYIYRRTALETFCELPDSHLEGLEKLEQLRMLENGMTLLCVDSPRDSVGVDTAEDIQKAEAYIQTWG